MFLPRNWVKSFTIHKHSSKLISTKIKLFEEQVAASVFMHVLTSKGTMCDREREREKGPRTALTIGHSRPNICVIIDHGVDSDQVPYQSRSGQLFVATSFHHRIHLTIVFQSGGGKRPHVA